MRSDSKKKSTPSDKRREPAGAGRRNQPRKPQVPDLRRVAGSMSAGECFQALVDLQERLLGPGGCPWDREQTHDSLRTYLIEETYEVLEALDAKDYRRLPEEFGDLLLQIVFHAALARAAGHFDIRDVIERIHTKLVRRHPHVFGNVTARSAGEVLKNWEELKAAERAALNGAKGGEEPRESILNGVPKTLPALLEAYQLTKRAAHIGFDWEDIEGLLEKLREETAELKETLGPAEDDKARARLEEEVGDLLFVAVNVARFLGVDPEIALKKANRKFKKRFQEMERKMWERGSRLADASREEMETLWERSKELK